MEYYEIKPKVVVAQLGARMHYAVPMLLHRAGMLAHFYTDLYSGPGSSVYGFSRVASFFSHKSIPPALRLFQARQDARLPGDKVTAFNMLGLRYARALKKAKAHERSKIFQEYAHLFGLSILKREWASASAFYAFQGAALPLFQSPKLFPRVKILEQIIAPPHLYKRVLAEERELWPGWELYFSEPEREEASEDDWARQEWASADAILCGSDFVAQGLCNVGIPSGKIYVLPYGVEISNFTFSKPFWSGQSGLRLLYVGEVGLRKGPQYLLEAVESLNSSLVKIRFVGPISISEPYLNMLQKRSEIIGQVSRSEILTHYAWADLFVLPTICEGSATVVYEALAAGLPVITTPHAGSIVRDGIDGFIVPIRNSQAITEKIDLLANNPALLAWMSKNARRRSQEFSWERYGERLSSLLLRIIKGHCNNDRF